MRPKVVDPRQVGLDPLGVGSVSVSRELRAWFQVGHHLVQQPWDVSGSRIGRPAVRLALGHVAGQPRDGEAQDLPGAHTHHHGHRDLCPSGMNEGLQLVHHDVAGTIGLPQGFHAFLVKPLGLASQILHLGLDGLRRAFQQGRHASHGRPGYRHLEDGAVEVGSVLLGDRLDLGGRERRATVPATIPGHGLVVVPRPIRPVLAIEPRRWVPVVLAGRVRADRTGVAHVRTVTEKSASYPSWDKFPDWILGFTGWIACSANTKLWQIDSLAVSALWPLTVSV